MLSQEKNPGKVINNWQFLELWIDPIIFPPRILMLIGDSSGFFQVYDPAQQYKPIFSSNTYDEVHSWLLEDEYERVDCRVLAEEVI